MNGLSLEDAYARYSEELVRYATVLVSNAVADDIVADTFADLLRNPGGSWAQAREPKAFLFGAVANHARMHHRQADRRRERERRFASAARSPELATANAAPDLSVAVLEELSVQQRAVAYLTYWHDFTVAQVAAALGVSDGTVRRQLARARARLREVVS